MTAGIHDLHLEQGATFRLSVTLLQAVVPPATVGLPVDLTDCVARMQIRATVADPAVLLSLTTGELPAGGITLGGVAGTISVLITDEQTAALTIIKGRYDLEVERVGGGDVVRYLKGRVYVDPEVTR